MATTLTGYEKSLNQYTKEELVQIAEKYTIYYIGDSGEGKTSGYRRLTKEKLISIIKNDDDYKDANPKINNRPINRIQPLVNKLNGNEKPEVIMNTILDVLGEGSNYVNSGKYYTFLYYAKTPKITYDQHPLILAGEMTPTGFFGFNYHWVGRGTSPIRQYTYPEVASPFFEVSIREFYSLRQLPYAKFITK
jgi:hypothetical protein